jgi:hypothetical protein
MLAIVRDAIDNRLYSVARQARAQRKYGAYHETFEVHSQMLLQVRDVLHRPIVVNIHVTLVSSTIEAVKGIFFVEGVNSLIFPPRFRCAKHQVPTKILIEKSSGISTVSMSVTSRYISRTKCISPEDALTILLEYESILFR